MGYRRFTDRDGNVWEIKDHSNREWQFAPASGSTGRPIAVPAPGYESDPFELSTEELQRILDSARPAGSPAPPRRSPFND